MKKIVIVGILFTTLVMADDGCPYLNAHAPKANQLSVLGGYGAQKGFTGNTLPVGQTGKQGLTNGFKRGFVGGVQYQRRLNKDVSMGVQAQTNDTYSLLFGVGF